LIHNYGGDEFEIATIGALLDLTGRFAVVCPRGALQAAAAPDGRCFYRVEPATKLYDEESFAAALDALDDAVDQACAEGGFDRGTSVLGGFSQGAGLALALALRMTARARPGGMIALSPPIHPPARVPWDIAGGRQVPVFIAHGTEDRTAPPADSQRLATELEAAGGEVVWRGYPARHQVTLEALWDAREWLASH
jgi:phospholipase/carboxylesterase